MEVDDLRGYYTKTWQHTLLDWCNQNQISDIRPYRWDSNEWQLIWPPYLADQNAPIIRVIHLYELENKFAAVSGAFSNHNSPPLRIAQAEPIEFAEIRLPAMLTRLKRSADKLTLATLKPFDTQPQSDPLQGYYRGR